VALANKDVFYDLLSRSARNGEIPCCRQEAPWGVAGDDSVLHTWGKNLSFHPHIHMMSPEAGYSDTGWRQGSKKFFLPVRAMSRKFRGLFVSLLRKAT
jgi:hypothetical protein